MRFASACTTCGRPRPRPTASPRALGLTCRAGPAACPAPPGAPMFTLGSRPHREGRLVTVAAQRKAGPSRIGPSVSASASADAVPLHLRELVHQHDHQFAWLAFDAATPWMHARTPCRAAPSWSPGRRSCQDPVGARRRRRPRASSSIRLAGAPGEAPTLGGGAAHAVALSFDALIGGKDAIVGDACLILCFPPSPCPLRRCFLSANNRASSTSPRFLALMLPRSRATNQ